MIDVSLFAFGFTHHRKVRKLSDAAFRLWVTAIDHANQDKSGGVVTEDDLDCYPRAPRGEDRERAIAELVSLNLWHNAGEAMWDIHDFDEWQSSRRPAEHQLNGRQLDQQAPAVQWPTPQQLGGRARAASSRTPAGTFAAGPAERQLAGPEPPAVEPADIQQNDQLAGPAGATRFPPDPLSDQKESECLGNEGTSGSGDPDQPTSKGSPAGRPRRPAARRTRLPADFVPTPEHVARAAAECLDLADQLVRFKLHAEGTGRLMANWNAAFTTWLMNAKQFGPRSGARSTQPVQPSHGRTGFENARVIR